MVGWLPTWRPGRQRGTSETPGSNVGQKRGVNRSLLGLAPAEQTAILLRSGERNGVRIEFVPARGTSQRCNNACGFTHPNNRESQAVVRRRACGHTDNADANASRKMLDRGVATIRARIDDPPDTVQIGDDQKRDHRDRVLERSGCREPGLLPGSQVGRSTPTASPAARARGRVASKWWGSTTLRSSEDCGSR